MSTANSKCVDNAVDQQNSTLWHSPDVNAMAR
ncbi:hypothetical protein LTSEBAI_4998, partial [Salmonella enterica subsp. enterica serovar Baildon str. R6-199]